MSNPTEASPDSSVQADGPVARMISEGGAVPPDSTRVPASARVQAEAQAAVDPAPVPAVSHGKLSAQINKLWTKVAHYALERAGELSPQTPPDVLEKASRRTRLAEDLLADFRDGTYSHISKRSIAVIGSGLALASKLGAPSEPSVTKLGSACVSMLVTELSADELRRYCRFKNYELQHYFG